jgi:hypothetical protein
VSRLAFLSGGDAPLVSPLRHARPHPRVADVSALRKLELRGEVAGVAGAIPLGPRRALLVGDDVRVPAGVRAYDMTSALAALEVEGEDLMRRMTELDLGALPAVGAILRGTPALLERRGGERFRLFVPQELGHFVAETIADLADGIER